MVTQHPLQSMEWGEFRKLSGVRVVREGGMQITIHKVPHTPWTIGYYPKGEIPTQEQTKVLARIAAENKCIFIKCEPREEIESENQKTKESKLGTMGFVAGRPLFTKYNFVLDVSPSETVLMASFKQKTRYNIRVSEKKGVTVEIDNSEGAFKKYLALTQETAKRQGFYSHSREYHQKMWDVLYPAGLAQLLVAKYQGEIITTWVLFKYGDTLYYPYGASTREHREVMANNLVMWEAIKLAKEWGLKYLDMWGALGPDPDPKDPWYGFHTFKSGYGADTWNTWEHGTTFARPLYRVYRIAESIRWRILRLIK